VHVARGMPLAFEGVSRFAQGMPAVVPFQSRSNSTLNMSAAPLKA
jgi:hypothetical protein